MKLEVNAKTGEVKKVPSTFKTEVFPEQKKVDYSKLIKLIEYAETQGWI